MQGVEMPLEERTALFAARCMAACEAIPHERLKSGHIKDQLFRAATGVAANYAEAEEPESRADFIHKTKVAMKELAETRMWLRVIAASGYLDANRLAPLVDESLQLSRIMGASVATARRRLREEGEDLERHGVSALVLILTNDNRALAHLQTCTLREEAFRPLRLFAYWG